MLCFIITLFSKFNFFLYFQKIRYFCSQLKKCQHKQKRKLVKIQNIHPSKYSKIKSIFSSFIKVSKVKQVVSKVLHNPTMKTNISAGMASSAPPLGTMLGQVNFKSAKIILL